MKSTGMARKIDDLGRLVLPAEIRRRFGLHEGSHVEISIDEGTIVLSKLEEGCVFCGSEEGIREFRSRPVCRDCISQLAEPAGAAAGAPAGEGGIGARPSPNNG